MRVAVATIAVLAVACSSKGEQKPKENKAAVETPRDAAPLPPDEWAEERFRMVEDTVVARGIKDARVIAALKLTPRHYFVPPSIRHQAYDDNPLPIYQGKDGTRLTISQPYIVATMTEAAKVKAGDKVLEIGTGSGYQAAVLAMMGAKVYTMEINEELAAHTKKVLQTLSFKDVQMKQGDGFFGWPDAGPFDAILITCATPMLPPPLFEQLKVGGRLVAPMGDDFEQDLVVIEKTSENDMRRESLMGVRFGLMHGEVDKHR